MRKLALLAMLIAMMVVPAMGLTCVNGGNTITATGDASASADFIKTPTGSMYESMVTVYGIGSAEARTAGVQSSISGYTLAAAQTTTTPGNIVVTSRIEQDYTDGAALAKISGSIVGDQIADGASAKAYACGNARATNPNWTQRDNEASVSGSVMANAYEADFAAGPVDMYAEISAFADVDTREILSSTEGLSENTFMGNFPGYAALTYAKADNKAGLTTGYGDIVLDTDDIPSINSICSFIQF